MHCKSIPQIGVEFFMFGIKPTLYRKYSKYYVQTSALWKLENQHFRCP